MSDEYIHRSLITAAAILILMPLFLTMFVPTTVTGASGDELIDGYERMTGQAGSTKISVWPLQGIYTPFTGEFYDEDEGKTITYGYTEDGWLYGQSVQSYAPSQYAGSSQAYSVYKAPDGMFRYWIDSADYSEEYGTGHRGTYTYATADDVADGKAQAVGDLIQRDSLGDLYNEVTFDVAQKSDIFFVDSTKKEDASGHFKYDYTGYRYAFVPISNYTAMDQDGQSKPIIATTTSLSLIWYVYAGQSGISGQLIISGSDGGTAYINAAQVLSAFRSTTSTATFPMVFNGIQMDIIIKIDPVHINAGESVEYCYNNGYWSVMVTSLSTESSAYLGTSYSKDPMQILETVWNLLTFNMGDYNLSPWIQTICSLIFYIPFYITIIVIALDKGVKVWVAVGILAAIEAIGSVWPF